MNFFLWFFFFTVDFLTNKNIQLSLHGWSEFQFEIYFGFKKKNKVYKLNLSSLSPTSNGHDPRERKGKTKFEGKSMFERKKKSFFDDYNVKDIHLQH